MNVQMPNFITWDIETVANAAAKDYFARKVYKAPANWKDPQKIEQHITEARHEDQQKAALRWWTGQVVCISLRWIHTGRSVTYVGPREENVLRQALDTLSLEAERPFLIGKSADIFDTPFIRGRLLALDLGIPEFLRPYRPVDDLDQIFGFSSRADQRGKLTDYAFGLGISGKTGHGTDVQAWFDRAELGDEAMWGKIAGYCADDNDINFEMLRRWLKPYQPTNTRLAPGPTQASRPESSAPGLTEADIDSAFGSASTPAASLVPNQDPTEF